MKAYNYTFIIFFFAFFLGTNCVLIAQVGINTTNPRKTLEVGGDMKISGYADIGSFKPLNDIDDSSFLIQEATGNVKSLDVSNPTSVALAYIQEYSIVNPNLDWVKEFDTGVDATDYVMIITSASFTLELDMSTGAEANSSLPYTATYIKQGTWHIKADYPKSANVDETAIGTWTISTLIFSSDVSKQFGTIDFPLFGLSVGSTLIPIID